MNTIHNLCIELRYYSGHFGKTTPIYVINDRLKDKYTNGVGAIKAMCPFLTNHNP